LRYTRLAETDTYVQSREQLRLAEIELLQHRERVAEMRRNLPEGAAVDDYVFLEGPKDLDAGDEPVSEVRLSELFSGPDRPLIVFQMMFGKAQESPCPMCTLWIDGFTGVANHIAENVDLVVVAAASVPELRAHARNRAWNGLRLLSAAENSFKFDLGSQDAEGNQSSTISVFDRDEDGTIRHTYTVQPQWSETDYQRGMDLYNPVWHLLDLTPQGRGDWYASL
jgi:predicted dithiol-disulfide oxidoreductase (DUF899 family)